MHTEASRHTLIADRKAAYLTLVLSINRLLFKFFNVFLSLIQYSIIPSSSWDDNDQKAHYERTMEEKRIAIYALTGVGTETVAKLAKTLSGSHAILPAKFQSSSENIPASFFNPGEFTAVLENNWNKFDAHIFIMATGIVVRKIAKLLKHKTVDPAVVVCDEKGNYAISLLSGHIGGANRLAEKVAVILNGKAVITTATDVQGIMAFDELAAINAWEVKNPENIKVLNTMLLEAKSIAVILPENIFNKHYAERKNVFLLTNTDDFKNNSYEGAVIYGLEDLPSEINIPILYLC